MTARKPISGRSKQAGGPTKKRKRPAHQANAMKPYATKDGRHQAFGALKDITRLVPGVDLTEPAFPEWADLLDQKYGPEVKK